MLDHRLAGRLQSVDERSSVLQHREPGVIVVDMRGISKGRKLSQYLRYSIGVAGTYGDAAIAVRGAIDSVGAHVVGRSQCGCEWRKRNWQEDDPPVDFDQDIPRA